MHADSYQGKVASETTTFWLDIVMCVSHLIRLHDYLINNISGKNQESSVSLQKKLIS